MRRTRASSSSSSSASSSAGAGDDGEKPKPLKRQRRKADDDTDGGHDASLSINNVSFASLPSEGPEDAGVVADMAAMRELHHSGVFAKIGDKTLELILCSGYLTSDHIVKHVSTACRRLRRITTSSTRCLQLASSKLDDDGLIPLASRYRNLAALDCSFTSLSDRSREPLRSLSHTLVYLSLRGTNVGNEAVYGLQDLHALRYLDISKSQAGQKSLITDMGVARLRFLTNLVWLNLSWNSVTDLGAMRVIECLPNLRCISLQCTQITDATLHTLATSCPKLLHADFNGCSSVTDAGVEGLITQCTELQGEALGINGEGEWGQDGKG